MINSIKRHRYSNRNICKHIIMELLSLITCLLHLICWLCHIREGSAMVWRRRERENKIERESGHYPWGGRQFSYSDWLIAQSCHEQEGTGHQESEEKWLWLWVRRKEGQLLFISIERTTYVVWENRFGAESALVRKTASLFSSFCLFSSCQTWWKVCAIFAETLRQVSYYTTMELKNKTKKTIETQFPNFAPIHQFTVFFVCVCGLFCQLKGAWIFHYSEWQLSELWLFVDLMPERDSKQEEREALQRLLVSCQRHLLMSCSLGSALHISPLENNKEMFRYSRDVYKRHLAWMWELLCTL